MDVALDIREKIRISLIDCAKEHTVADIRIGLGYSAVTLDNGQAGLAYTFHKDLPERCNLFSGQLPLTGKPAAALLDLINSDNKVECAVGIATANALTNKDSDRVIPGDVLNIIDLRSTDCVGMVGFFAPLVGAIRKKSKELIVFDQYHNEYSNILPSSDIETRLSSCQVAIITATSIINRTFEKILPHVEKCREVVILGASTPLTPDIFKNTPITCLSGVIVTDPEAILNIVGCGGGMPHFKHHVNKVSIKLK